MGDLPDESQLSRYFSMLGKKGAKKRYAQMTPEQRKELATKASKAAAKRRTADAKKRRRQ
jgi:phage gp16-like protein